LFWHGLIAFTLTLLHLSVFTVWKDEINDLTFHSKYFKRELTQTNSSKTVEPSTTMPWSMSTRSVHSLTVFHPYCSYFFYLLINHTDTAISSKVKMIARRSNLLCKKKTLICDHQLLICEDLLLRSDRRVSRVPQGSLRLTQLIRVKSHSSPQILLSDLFKLRWYLIPSHPFNITVFVTQEVL